MMQPVYLGFVLFAFLGLVNGFGFLGHRLASLCIWKQLSPEARARLVLIVTKSKFLTLGGWPDVIKRQAGWTWTKKLHYLDTLDDPPSLCKIPDPSIIRKSPNVISAAMNYTQRFQHNFNNGVGSVKEDLGFMMHFIMDLHQPLHLVRKARGGNDYKVWYRGKRVNVHLLWDSKIIKRLLLSNGYKKLSEMIIQRQETKKANDKANDNSIWDWAEEANRMNCEFVFNTDGHPDAEVWETQLIQILAKGTKRIAHLIEDTLSGNNSAQ